MAQFNIALLAKQGWRLLAHPNSLVAKVLNAKYFPENDFLNSRFRNRSSISAKFFVGRFGLSGETVTLGYMKTQIDQVVKVNFDGAYDARNHQSASGIMVRDSKGHVLISFTEFHRGVASPFAAEPIACPKATQIGAYIHDIHEMKSRGRKISFVHIPRLANGLAHTLATESIKRREEMYLIESIPSYAEGIMRSEWVQEPD
ncbi:hypothetical protein CXB51_032702 [Gossypium anomalum]|uniref:RNase H type-1 domain-containing protein n=1 Tax=Gossypium anomalum TaxID=47600 RepID=A0A8J6CMP4_9ROSI|nr:hypothetical protein CXB51_032702 [Gossypium anomalum]